MRKSSPTAFPPVETIEEIRVRIELSLAKLKLFRAETETFERHVEEAATYLESAKRHAQALR
jgi:hypothetical protein